MTPNSPTEYVILGALMSGPKHGYEIMHFLGSALEATWRVSRSQLYVLLKRLEREGCLVSSSESLGLRPPKRVFHLTRKGKEVFLEWLNSPVKHPRDFRMEFLCKMFFFDHLSLPGLRSTVETQIKVLEQLLENIQARPERHEGAFMGLVHGFKVRNVDCLLSWLQEEVLPFAEKKS